MRCFALWIHLITYLTASLTASLTPFLPIMTTIPSLTIGTAFSSLSEAKNALLRHTIACGESYNVGKQDTKYYF
jgi:hypothetical protein